jgi:putative ABC transport system ATP-binding protein
MSEHTEPAVAAAPTAPAVEPQKPASVICNVDGCVVSATALTKRYQLGKDNFVDALRGATVHIRPGEMVAIMGPSGSGKSTMMHMIGCLDTPDAGEVWIGGRRADTLRGKALTRLRSQEIGFIFQGFNLIPTLSATENVALAAEYAGRSRGAAADRARELLDLVGLGDRAGHLPSELSGGQQQRVAIARSLINEPSVVLGDEPTGDLDTKTSDEIIEMMRTVNLETGTTFILVTHNPEVAEACDRTILMRDGLVYDDDYDEAEREADAARRAVEARERKVRIREARDAAKSRANHDGAAPTAAPATPMGSADGAGTSGP